MITQAQGLKAEIERLDRVIAEANELAESAEDPETAQIWRDYASAVGRRKAQAQKYLEREEAPLRKPQPKKDVKAAPGSPISV